MDLSSHDLLQCCRKDYSLLVGIFDPTDWAYALF